MDTHLSFQANNKVIDLTSIVDQLNDCIAVFDSTGICEYINQSFAALLGVTQKSIPSHINLFQLIENPETLDEITRTIKNESAWKGSCQTNLVVNDVRLVITFIAALDSINGPLFAYFVPVGRATLESQIWDKLLASEERYRTLVELSPNLIQIHINKEITFINSAGVQLLGASSANEIIGQSILNFIHPKEHPHVLGRINREFVNREKMGPVEECWLRADGSELDVEIIALPYDYHGQVAVQVIGIDITERKQAREQLRQYASRLLALNAIGLALVSSLNTNEILDQVTKNLTDTLLANSLSILLKQGRDFNVVASAGEGPNAALNLRVPSSVVEQLFDSLSGGITLISDKERTAYPFHPVDPSHFLLLVKVMIGEEVIGILQASYSSSIDDLTAEQNTLQSVSNWIAVALQNSRLYNNELRQHQYAEGLLESASAINSNLELSQVLERILQQVWRVIPCSAANIMVIEEGEAYLVSSIGYDYLSLEAEWVKSIRLPLSKIVHFRQIQETRKPLIIPNIQKDSSWVNIGNPRIMSYAAAPLIVNNCVYGFLNLDSEQPDYFDQETILRLQAFAVQASIAIQNAQLVKDLQNALRHEQNMRNQLVQSEKLAAMGRMVASVAHELNNPLQTIQNCLFILQKEGSIRSDLVEYLDTGLSEVKRLSGIVDQLREVYRPSTQTSNVPVKLIELLENVHALLKHQLQHKKINWEISGDFTIAIKANIDPLKQVFINLTQNAIEAMDPGGGTLTIELSKDSDGKKAGIHFRDTGRGISENILSNIFDPFFTTREMGFGLGLAICRDIVENQGGTIQVESSPGHGSTFSVWLPIWINE